MSAPILATKLHVPTPQPGYVLRPRLVERLNAGLHRKLTLISAAAGFGKTTLVSEWINGSERPVAWLSLDAADSDCMRFLTYVVVALQTFAPDVGSGVLGALRSLQPPPVEAILTSLLNEISAIPDEIVLVLDDYHVIDARQVDDALNFLIEHLPPQMHLVITTREDPQIPLARLRSLGQLTELRAADMRFTMSEATSFLNQTMGLHLTEDDIAALETRTEGWIAGLQLAAISMQGQEDTSSFIQSFSGSHRFVLDYLMEEVLHQQPEQIQMFLLHTSVLDRICGTLCDALLPDSPATGQETLEYLEHANLFIVPLDNERRWYRYHHLFGELLRQRLDLWLSRTTTDDQSGVAELHLRASAWYEEHELEIEAFMHATAAEDFERAEYLLHGKDTPLYVRGGITPITNWLASLPESVLNARPMLWVTFATVLIMVGQISRGERKIRAAEGAMQGVIPDDQARQVAAYIADLRSLVGLLAADPHYLDVIIARALRPSEHLPAALPTVPPVILWMRGLAYYYRGDRSAAGKAFSESIALSESQGNIHGNILATTGLAKLHEVDNQLQQATEMFRRVLYLVGDPPGLFASEAFVGLARILYEWNDLDAAQRHGLQSVSLARQSELANFIASEVFLARLQLARGDVDGALSALAGTAQAALQRDFQFWMPDIAATQVRALLQHGKVAEADELAQTYGLPLSLARVRLAQGDATAALATLAQHRLNIAAEGWSGERLTAMLLEAVAHQAQGNTDAAIQVLEEALRLSEPEGLIRTFIDEGAPMAHLLASASAHGIAPHYTGTLLAAFEAEGHTIAEAQRPPPVGSGQPLVEPLSERELEILDLIARGLSNREISDRLYLALSTVKGHNRNIFGKLQVQRRTEAVARARDLGLM